MENFEIDYENTEEMSNHSYFLLEYIIHKIRENDQKRKNEYDTNKLVNQYFDDFHY
jgi:hypothetical protein